MPELDGYAATRHIRVREARSAHTQASAAPNPSLSTPTAHDFPSDQAINLDHGCNDFMQNPSQ